MSSFVGSFQSFGGWQQLSRLSLLSSFRCFDFTHLIITCFGEFVLSVSLHVYFILFAIYAYLTCCLWEISTAILLSIDILIFMLFPILNYVELLWNPSVDISWSKLFMSYLVGYFQSIGDWQQLSMLSLLSCFLSFGFSTSGTLSSPVLVKLYFTCLFMLIMYGLQMIPILLVPCTVLSGDDSFPWCI